MTGTAETRSALTGSAVVDEYAFPEMALAGALVITGIALGIGTRIATLAGDTDITPRGLYRAAAFTLLLGLAGCVRSARRLLVGPPDNEMVIEDPEDRPTLPHDVPAENATLSVAASQHYISSQLQSIGGLDAQLIGMAVVLSTGGGVFAVIPHALNDDRWVLLLGVCLTGLTCLLGLLFCPDPDPGPIPASLFADYASVLPRDYAWYLLTELTRRIPTNDRAIVSRRGVINGAFVLLATTFVVWGAVRAV